MKINFTPKWAEPKRDLNKWQFTFQVYEDYTQFGYTRVLLGFFKLVERPTKNELLIGGHHYKGFLLNKAFKTSWQ